MSIQNLFQAEAARTFISLRSFAMKTGFTLLTGLPFLLIQMPQAMRLSGLLFIILMISFFGAAVSHTRLKSEGYWRRLKLLPKSNAMLLFELIMAGALVDAIQCCLLLMMYIALYGSGFSAGLIIASAGALFMALLALNALGRLLGAVVSSNGEVHLYAGLTAMLLAIGSNLVPLPQRIASMIAPASALSPLHFFGRFLKRLSDPVAALSSMHVFAGWIAGAIFIVIILFYTVNRSTSGRSA